MLVTMKEWLKIGAELPKLSPNKTGYPFFGPPCTIQLQVGLHVQQQLSP